MEAIAAGMSKSLVGDEEGLVVYYSMNHPVEGAGEVVPNDAVTGAAYDGVTDGTDTTPYQERSEALPE